MEAQEKEPIEQRSPWSLLLDKIAFGILNWRSTLKGFLLIYNIVFATLTSEQAKMPGVHYAQWFLSSGLVAQAIAAWLSSDRSELPVGSNDLNSLPQQAISSGAASSK